MTMRPARDDLVSIPENPVPEGAVVRVLRAADGVSLRAARFPPALRPVLGTVCLFPGRTEFIEKYFEVIGDLTRRGFAVAVPDWRGQGGSERMLRDGRKGHVRDFAEYQRDADVFMRDFVLTECPPPYFCLAHSMGGAIALMAARRRSTWFERIVLTAPMLGLPRLAARPIARNLARVLGTLGAGSCYVPGFPRHLTGLGPFEGNPLTSDPLRYGRTAAILRAAPELGVAGPTVSWVRAAFRAMAYLKSLAYARGMQVPVLFLAGSQDEVVSNASIERVASGLRTARVLTFDGARHELLMESDPIRDRAFAAIDAFIPGTPPFPD